MHDYMATLARLHRLPLQPFVDAGVERAATPAGSGLYGIERFETVWRAGKSAPNPLLEFMLGWMKRNPVDTRGRESTIVWDSGQMHQQDGRLIALLDVEIGHIGDPMMDLAAPRMRDTVLHFGDFANLYAEYERAGGFPVDIDAVQLHHIAFTLTNEMAFRNSLNDPVPDLDRRQIRDKATLGPPGSAMAAHHTCQPFEPPCRVPGSATVESGVGASSEVLIAVKMSVHVGVRFFFGSPLGLSRVIVVR
jgi:aminoglycoside phosphotransferase (APT) family kinase protein